MPALQGIDFYTLAAVFRELDPEAQRIVLLGLNRGQADEFARIASGTDLLRHLPDPERERRIAGEIANREDMEEAARRFLEKQKRLLTSPDGMAALAQEFGADVLTSGQLDDIPEPEPIIDGYLDKGSLVRIFGPPKSLKSFIALSMACAVASGLRWFGFRTEPARVLYVVAEGVRGTRKRVRAWEQEHGRQTEVRFYPRAVQIGDPDQQRRLIAYARTYGFEFVIFDTQARCTVGVKENDNTEMGVIIAALDALKDVTGACVMLVHHSGTEGGRGRGATAWDGAVDAEFEVRRDEGSMRVALVTRFQKDVAEAVDLLLEGHQVGDSLVFRLRGDAAPVAVEVIVTGKQAMVLRAISEYGEVGVSVTGIATALGLGAAERGKCGTHVSALLKKELIKKITGSARYEITYAGRQQLDALSRAAVADRPGHVQDMIEEPE
ncbi:AAA family ATPase [Streptomyces venezuelae]|uniref:AAA family ATPase n=1 Tax=Streptomyces venezuelae TaxID=54571 RepID=UPI00123AD4C5|nr:AAA family ATPase [Streptomyces venezuelae]